MKIYTIGNKNEEQFLRCQAVDFDFSQHSRNDIRQLIKAMRQKMKEANGVGLSANQVGFNFRVFVARVDNKFYTVFNPKIVKKSAELVELEEGCLSVPEKFGLVKRPERVWLEGFDASGRKIKIKAWGLLARVFQHEVDHLNGTLFIDKATKVYQAESTQNQLLEVGPPNVEKT